MRAFIFMLLCAVFTPGHTQVFDRLYEDSVTPALSQPLSWLAVPKGSIASPDAFTNDAARWNFQDYRSSTILPTSPKQEAWIRFALPPTKTLQTWFVRIPRQTIIKVTLFTRDASGGWNSQSAGDAIAPAQWNMRARVPSFELQTRNDREQLYYMRFEHRIAITERPMMVSPVDYIDGSSRVGLVIGLMLGMFNVLAILCLGAYAITRSKIFLSFSATVLTLMFTQLVLIGYGGWRVWPDSAYLNQVMPWTSAMLALASAGWFCSQVSYARDSHPRIQVILSVLGWSSLLLAFMVASPYEFIPREFRNLWIGVGISCITACMVWMSLRGHRGNLLLLVGAIPIFLSTLARLGYNTGWTPHVEIARTASALASMAGLTWIFFVLAWRSRESLLAHERASALASYDAPTGLMLPHVVDIRMPQMLLRAGRIKSGCGVLLLRWVEYAQIQDVMNNDKRNAGLARIGAILRGVSRDVDTAVRYSEDEFMMLVEGPVSRNSLSQAATEILAACIRFSEKPGNHVPLTLHIAIWHGDTGMHITQTVIDLLKSRLQRMASGTRKPVQFVDADHADLSTGGNADSRKKDLLDKINALEVLEPETYRASTPS